MLQANVLPPESAGEYMPWWTGGAGPPQWRDAPHFGLGGLVVDWEMRTTLEGLYAAGNQVAGSGGHVFAATTGRYAERNMVEYCNEAKPVAIDRKQVELKYWIKPPYAPTYKENYERYSRL